VKYLIYGFRMFYLLSIFCFTATISASFAEVIPVSPVLPEGVAICESCRPTFSWSADSDAQGYRILIFLTDGEDIISCDEMQTQSEPVLQALIPAPASTWTPGSVDTGLESGSTYVWYVQVYDELGGGSWSQGALFRIDPAQMIGLFDKALAEEIKVFNTGEITADAGLLTFATFMQDLFEYRQAVDNSALTAENEITLLPRGTIEGEELYNTFFGIEAGESLDSGGGGQFNSIFGGLAGKKTTTGASNTFIGDSAGFYNIIGSSNTFVGADAGFDNTASNNTFVGYDSGMANTTGTKNVFLGVSTGTANSGADADYNTFLGAQAGEKNTTGHRNTFVGGVAGNDNTTGDWNTYLGVDAGRDCTDGRYNVCIGFETGMTSPYYGNTLVGSRAGNAISGSTALYNCFLGYKSGLLTTSGTRNTFLGAYAGENNTAGGYNVFIGYSAGLNETGSNKLYIDNGNTSTPLIYGEFDNDLLRVNGTLEISSLAGPSDRRLKKEIAPIKNVLQKIQKLDGVSFQWRQDEFPDRWFAQGRQLGLIAQEVEKILPELVETDAKGYKSVEYIQLIPVLLEGLKEQQREINTLKESLKKLLQEHNQNGAS